MIPSHSPYNRAQGSDTSESASSYLYLFYLIGKMMACRIKTQKKQNDKNNLIHKDITRLQLRFSALSRPEEGVNGTLIQREVWENRWGDKETVILYIYVLHSCVSMQVVMWEVHTDCSN